MLKIALLINSTNSVLYSAVTSNLVKRIYQHKENLVDDYSKRYNLLEPHHTRAGPLSRLSSHRMTVLLSNIVLVLNRTYATLILLIAKVKRHKSAVFNLMNFLTLPISHESLLLILYQQFYYN